MIIRVQAKPNSKEAYVRHFTPADAEEGEQCYEVAVKEPPLAGRANAAIIRALGEHFHVPAHAVRIVSGRTSRRKIVEIHYTK